jgi:hypothetical protein
LVLLHRASYTVQQAISRWISRRTQQVARAYPYSMMHRRSDRVE